MASAGAGLASGAVPLSLAPLQFVFLATLLVLEGKVDEGIDAYKELLARDPSYYRGWSSIAEVYMRRHMENPAETRFLSLALEAWRKSCRIKQEGNLACGMVEKIEREHPGVPNAEGAP